MSITAAATLREILRVRPLAAEILEKETGYQVWNCLDEPLSDFCAGTRMSAGLFTERLSRLPAVPADTNWNSKPIYYLIDHLTRNHDDFRDREMPAITALLATDLLPAYPDKYVIKLLVQEFKYFQQEFLKHMHEEETFLFPKIMRNEACYRFKELEPEVHKGSVNLYFKLETHKPEVEFKRMITSIKDKLHNRILKDSAADIAVKVQAALGSLATRLTLHADLETDVLFPRAGRLEQELYESYAPGISRFPGDQ